MTSQKICHTSILHFFDFWADPVVHLLLLKSSMTEVVNGVTCELLLFKLSWTPLSRKLWFVLPSSSSIPAILPPLNSACSDLKWKTLQFNSVTRLGSLSPFGHFYGLFGVTFSLRLGLKVSVSVVDWITLKLRHWRQPSFIHSYLQNIT